MHPDVDSIRPWCCKHCTRDLPDQIRIGCVPNAGHLSMQASVWNTTVSEVKAFIAHVMHIPVSQQSLAYGGRILRDQCLLSQCRITPLSVIHLFVLSASGIDTHLCSPHSRHALHTHAGSDYRCAQCDELLPDRASVVRHISSSHKAVRSNCESEPAPPTATEPRNIGHKDAELDHAPTIDELKSTFCRDVERLIADIYASLCDPPRYVYDPFALAHTLLIGFRDNLNRRLAMLPAHLRLLCLLSTRSSIATCIGRIHYQLLGCSPSCEYHQKVRAYAVAMRCLPFSRKRVYEEWKLATQPNVVQDTQADSWC